MKTLQLVFLSTVAFLLIGLATLKIRTNAERVPVVVGSVVLEEKRRSKVGGSNPRLLTDRKGNVIGASTDTKDHKTAAANKVDGRAQKRTETKSTAGDNHDMNDEGDEPNPSYHHAGGCGSSTTSSHQLDNPCWVHRNGVYLPTHRRRRPWRKRSSSSTLPNS